MKILNRLNSVKPSRYSGIFLTLLALVIFAASVAVVVAGDTNMPPAKVEAVKPAKKVAKKLTGAELYQINCNRCHPERYPTEFTSSQWKSIMTHMRVRANIPAAQAREILKYLQQDSGN